MKTTWLLTDNIIGHRNQAIALAKIAQLKFIEKRLDYNCLSRLPAYWGLGLNILSVKAKNTLLADILPDVIISAGRRAAQVALGLKRLKSNIKLIQILNPKLHLKQFDLLVLPEHDKTEKLAALSNVFFIRGAVSYLELPKEIPQNLKWIEQDTASQAKIAVLLGGNAKGCRFTTEHIQELVSLITIIARRKHALLFITGSRRTPGVLMNALSRALHQAGIKYYLYHYKSHGPNPYAAFLKLADAIIATGDSVSMCSEACSISKPTFIYTHPQLVSPKHRCFTQSLFNKGVAQPLTRQSEIYIPNVDEEMQFLQDRVEQVISD